MLRLPQKLLPLLLLLCLTMASGCSLPGLGGNDKPVKTSYYLDANLGLGIAVPRAWSVAPSTCPRPDFDPCTVRWKGAGGSNLAMMIESLPPHLASGGYDSLLAYFQKAHPGFETTSIKPLALAGAPGRQLTGHTPARSYLTTLITTANRAFVIEFSAPHEHFDGYRALFDYLLGTFTALY